MPPKKGKGRGRGRAPEQQEQQRPGPPRQEQREERQRYEPPPRREAMPQEQARGAGGPRQVRQEERQPSEPPPSRGQEQEPQKRGRPPPQQSPTSPEDVEMLKKMAGLEFERKAPEASKQKYTMAKRPGYGTLGRKIALLVNYFQLQFKDTSVYHYDIDIAEVGKDKKAGPSLMSQGRTVKEAIKKNVAHVEHQQKRNMGKAKCREIITKMVQANALSQYCPVYDGQKNLFTCKSLPIKKEHSFDVQLDLEGRQKIFRVTIKPVQKEDNTNIISLEPLRLMLSGRSTEIPQEVILVFDTVMNHREPPITQVQARTSFFNFSEAGRDPLGMGLEIWYGYNQSVRLTQQGPVVVINLAAKAFHKQGPIIDYACDVLQTDITRLPRLEYMQISTLQDALKGVQVKVTHLNYPRRYKIKGVSKVAARDLEQEIDGKKMSVAQYFEKKYRRLRFPFLPCLQMQSSNQTYVPFEVCEVVEGQPKVGKLTGEQTAAMIKRTAITPNDRFNHILDSAKEVKAISGKAMNAFGLIMEVAFTKVDGRVLTAPALAYGEGQKCNPKPNGVWQMDGKFFKAVRVESWMLISFASDRFCGMDKLENFCKLLVSSSRRCGMILDRPIDIKIYNRNVKTEKAIMDAKQKGAEFAIIVMSPRDTAHSYEEVKFLADFKFNLVTQCILDKTVGRINAQITTNVCLKLNAKLGGINHVLLQSRQIFSEPVIVFGADAIHWPRDYGYPSIAAVVGSLNPTATRYALTCRLQKNVKEGRLSQEIIREMKDIVSGILANFETAVGRRPNKIIFYRDGVSEGQFTAALENEVSSIQTACLERYNIILPITYIVVQKRHQTRLRPYDPREAVGRGGNVPPGTTVDTKITHPTFFDYFVCSHEGIQGTSKPAHYTVLHDDNHYSADYLQQLSYFLCHLYVRCNRSVSIPAPVLYADLAAERAKKYADLFAERDSASSGSGGGSRDLPPHVKEAIENMRSFQNNMFYV